MILVDTDQVTHIFQDAWVLYAAAMEELRQGKLRNAAEKAWGATKRATDALILARTGEEPRTVGQTTRQLRILARQDQQARELVRLFGDRAHFLHGTCFYDGMCEPLEAAEEDVRETADYIRAAQELAGADHG